MTKEVLTIILSFIVGYAIDGIWARLVRGLHFERKEYKKVKINKIRIHHNIVGYIIILVGFFFYPLILIPMGFGIIVGHGMRKGEPFWFLEKSK